MPRIRQYVSVQKPDRHHLTVAHAVGSSDEDNCCLYDYNVVEPSLCMRTSARLSIRYRIWMNQV